MKLFQAHEVRQSEYLTRKLENERKAKEKSTLTLDMAIETIIWLAAIVAAVKLRDFTFVFCVGGLLATFIHIMIRI